MKLSIGHVLILGFFLTGCGQQAETVTETASNAGAEASQAQPPQQENAGISLDRDLWTADVSHVGPLAADTHFDPDAIAALLPEYDIRSGTHSREGEAVETLILTRPGAASPAIEILASADASRIEEVLIYESGRIADQRAEIGDRFAGSGFTRADCWPGIEERSGMVVCYPQDNPYLGYWFENTDYAGPDGELPPAEVLDAATVALLRWWNSEAD